MNTSNDYTDILWNLSPVSWQTGDTYTNREIVRLTNDLLGDADIALDSQGFPGEMKDSMRARYARQLLVRLGNIARIAMITDEVTV